MKKIVMSLLCVASVISCAPPPVVCPPEPVKVTCTRPGFVETRIDQFSVCCMGQVVEGPDNVKLLILGCELPAPVETK